MLGVDRIGRFILGSLGLPQAPKCGCPASAGPAGQASYFSCSMTWDALLDLHGIGHNKTTFWNSAVSLQYRICCVLVRDLTRSELTGVPAATPGSPL